jgi:heat shock protein 5
LDARSLPVDDWLRSGLNHGLDGLKSGEAEGCAARQIDEGAGPLVRDLDDYQVSDCSSLRESDGQFDETDVCRDEQCEPEDEAGRRQIAGDQMTSQRNWALKLCNMCAYLRWKLWNMIKTLAPGLFFLLGIQMLRNIIMNTTNLARISRRLPSNQEDMKDLIFFYVSRGHRERMRASLNRLVGEALDQAVDEGMADFMSRFGSFNYCEFNMGNRSGAKETEIALKRFFERCERNRFRIEWYIPHEFENCQKSIKQNLTRYVQQQYATQELKKKEILILEVQQIGERVVLMFRTKGDAAADRMVWHNTSDSEIRLRVRGFREQADAEFHQRIGLLCQLAGTMISSELAEIGEAVGKNLSEQLTIIFDTRKQEEERKRERETEKCYARAIAKNVTREWKQNFTDGVKILKYAEFFARDRSGSQEVSTAKKGFVSRCKSRHPTIEMDIPHEIEMYQAKVEAKVLCHITSQYVELEPIMKESLTVDAQMLGEEITSIWKQKGNEGVDAIRWNRSTVLEISSHAENISRRAVREYEIRLECLCIDVKKIIPDEIANIENDIGRNLSEYLNAAFRARKEEQRINMESESGPIIGIDLGTTYSCVGIFRNGKIEMIENEDGLRSMPSIVAFNGIECLVGQAAKNQMVENPTNTITGIKRLIGLDFLDMNVQNEICRHQYRIVDRDGKPHAEVNWEGKMMLQSPEQISAKILTKMKNIAENYLGLEVNDAVITVPAYFKDCQRRATVEAGRLAGLNVLRILNEATAAGLAHGLGMKEKRNIVVFDLGGTLDVSVVECDHLVFTVRATSGDTHLGGEDFDQRLIEHMKATYENQTGKELKHNSKALAKLKREAEKAKHTLSSEYEANIQLDNFNDGDDFSITITRARFEELTFDLFQKTLNPLRAALDDSGFNKSGIDDILLVGGSTHIPKIRELVRDFFDGREPSTRIDPLEAVGQGAAIQAAALRNRSILDSLVLRNVNPLTLGIDVIGDIICPIIPKNTLIPVTKWKVFCTSSDDQTGFLVEIFEGERASTKNNHLLGSFQLKGIRPAPRCTQKINVTFEIDENGMLSVRAENMESHKIERIAINGPQTRLREAEREEAIRQARENQREDDKVREGARAWKRFDSYLLNARDRLWEAGNASAEQKDRVANDITRESNWLRANLHLDSDQYDEKLKTVRERLEPQLRAIAATRAEF